MHTTKAKITFSAGYDSGKLRTYRTLFSYYKKNKDFAKRDAELFKRSAQIVSSHSNKPLNEMRILEIGAGQRFPISLLYHSAGTRVTGIDADVVGPWISFSRMIASYKTNGLERFLKTMVRHVLFDGSYYRALSKHAGIDLKHNGVDLQMVNAQNMKFQDNEFDFIFSHAVFEHISNVQEAAKEAARVLKDKGTAYIHIDLFPHLSGGHHLDWAFPNEASSHTVPAWDHLRNNLFPTHVYLNKLAEKDYINIFSQYFDILDNESFYEGETYLTEEIKNELSQYSVEDLTKKSIRLTLRKK